MNRRVLRWTMVAAVVAATSSLQAGDLTADLTVESRVFPSASPYGEASQLSGAMNLSVEYVHAWNRDADLLVIAPLLRIDLRDDQRSLADIQELYWQKRFRAWDLRLGYRRVFWGVTESVHLVDFVNQTDLSGSIDSEEKLGQPMAQVTWISPWGALEAFWMPLFRERRFPGRTGRLRPALVVDPSDARYESGSKRWHQDWALRWSRTLGDMDFGVSYFSGTDREPRFEPRIDGDGMPTLIPRYRLTQRLGLDLSLVIGGWLWKLEALVRDYQSERSTAMVAGFEYTLVGVAGSRYDLGILVEYLYDERGSTASPFEHDVFVGGRLALNDVGGSSILFGTIVDTDQRSRLGLLEASTRLSDLWSLEAELRVFAGFKPPEQLFDLRNDDYVSLRLTRHY